MCAASSASSTSMVTMVASAAVVVATVAAAAAAARSLARALQLLPTGEGRTYVGPNHPWSDPILTLLSFSLYERERLQEDAVVGSEVQKECSQAL